MPHCSTVLANEGTAAVSMWIFHHAARNKTLFRTGPMYHVLLDPLNRNHSLLDACYFMDSLSATVNHKQRRSVDQLGLTKAVEMPSADMKTWILPGAFLFSLCLTKWTAVVKGKINHNKAKQKKKVPASICVCTQMWRQHTASTAGAWMASCSTLGFIFLLGGSLDNPLSGSDSLQKQPGMKCPDAGKTGYDKNALRIWAHKPTFVQSSVDLSIEGFPLVSTFEASLSRLGCTKFNKYWFCSGEPWT